MAADEYYDAIGTVLSYVLSAEDFIYGQTRTGSGICFNIIRDNTNLVLFASPNKRYFTLSYEFSLTKVLSQKYEDNNQLLRKHMEEYDIDDSAIRDENLNKIVAYRRISDVGEEQAQKVVTDIKALMVHSDCRLKRLEESDTQDNDKKIWDGVEAIGLLYPYEDDFKPRDYEIVAQEVISVGNQVDETMEKLDIMEEIDSGSA